MTDDLLKRAFEALEIAEGYVAAAAYRESTSPPYEAGKARRDIATVREALAELQRTIKKD